MACCRLEIRLESRSVSEGGRSALGTKEWTCKFCKQSVQGSWEWSPTWSHGCASVSTMTFKGWSYHLLKLLLRLCPIKQYSGCVDWGSWPPRKIWRLLDSLDTQNTNEAICDLKIQRENHSWVISVPNSIFDLGVHLQTHSLPNSVFIVSINWYISCVDHFVDRHKDSTWTREAWRT